MLSNAAAQPTPKAVGWSGWLEGSQPPPLANNKAPDTHGQRKYREDHTPGEVSGVRNIRQMVYICSALTCAVVINLTYIETYVGRVILPCEKQQQDRQ